MRSLRTNLLLGTSIGIAVVLLVVGILLNVLVRKSLVEQFDTALFDEARLLASTIEFEEGGVVLDFAELNLITLKESARPAFMQIWLNEAQVIHRSPSLGDADLERPSGPHVSEGFLGVMLPDGEVGRSVGLTFLPQEEFEEEEEEDDDDEASLPEKEEDDQEAKTKVPLVTLVLARHTAPIDEVLSRLLARLTVVGILTLLVLIIVLSLVIHRALRPLNQLATRISGLDEKNLAVRLTAGVAPYEVRPIIDQLNNLLLRLTKAFERERSFSADIAHELRTPLSGLRSTIDVVLVKTRPAGEYKEALGECLEITLRMQNMVSRLLYQGRLESGQVDLQPEPIQVNQLIRSAWKALEDRAGEQRLKISWNLGEYDTLISDLSLFTLVIQNVLENAIEHSEERSYIRVETAFETSEAIIRVSNSGSVLSRDEVQQVFERFWRGDAARNSAGGHCGLGLALVKRAMDVLGGEVDVQSEAGGEFIITISLPPPAHILPPTEPP